MLDADGHFLGVLALFRRIGPRGGRFHAALFDELSSQVRFILERGIQPTHLNGHQYVELLPTIRDVVAELLDTFHIRVVRAAAEPSLWPMVFGRGLRPSGMVFAAAQQYFARQFCRRMDRLAVGHADRFFGTALAGRIENAPDAGVSGEDLGKRRRVERIERRERLERVEKALAAADGNLSPSGGRGRDGPGGRLARSLGRIEAA